MNPRPLVTALLLLSPAGLQAQDLSALFLFKASWYQQSSAGEPTLIPMGDGPFDISAIAYLSNELLNDPDALMFISGMSLRAPGGTTRGMDLDLGVGGFFFSEEAVSASALNGRFGAGSYSFTISSFLTGDSTYSVPLSADSYPSAPRVLNFAAAQSVDPTRDFTLQWAAFTGGTDQEIWLIVFEPDTQTVVYDVGPLPDTSTSAVIPAGTLEAGKDYGVDILFSRYTHASPDTLPETYAGFDTHTKLPLLARTGGGPLDPPQIAGVRLSPSGDLELTVTCTPGRPLNLLGSPTVDGSWSGLQTSTPGASPATVVVPKATLGTQHFLRVSQQ